MSAVSCCSPKRPFTWLALFALTLLLIPALLVGMVVSPGPLNVATTVIVPRGTYASAVARSLADKNAVYHPLLFRVAARVIAHGHLKAGEYQIASGMSVADIVVMMREGRSVVRRLTIPEGLTSANIASILQGDVALTGELDVSKLEEGNLLPETYRYSYGDARAEVVARMREGMETLLGELWQKRDAGLPLNAPEEAVIMASIIEKETGKAAERPRIAGVFYNRIRAHMRLQSDPTVIYAIWKAKGSVELPLSHEDMSFSSPYNTYTSDGLPPYPICNPGRASLEAALHPEPNDFYYFVADGMGGHVFSRTLAEHNRNIFAQGRPKRNPRYPGKTGSK